MRFGSLIRRLNRVVSTVVKLLSQLRQFRFPGKEVLVDSGSTKSFTWHA